MGEDTLNLGTGILYAMNDNGAYHYIGGVSIADVQYTRHNTLNDSAILPFEHSKATSLTVGGGIMSNSIWNKLMFEAMLCEFRHKFKRNIHLMNYGKTHRLKTKNLKIIRRNIDKYNQKLIGLLR